MKLDEALAYKDSLDAVEAGAFNSTQAAEVDAIIVGVSQYLSGLAFKVAGFKTALTSLAVFSDAVSSAVKASIDGPDKLPSPRVQIYGGVVMTADEIAAKIAADLAAQKAAADQAAINLLP